MGRDEMTRMTVALKRRVYEAIKERASQQYRTMTAQINHDLEVLYGQRDSEANAEEIVT
jgi:hypothetical protein